MAPKGLLSRRVPINQRDYDYNAISQQFDKILGPLRSLSGSALTPGAIGLPSVDTPVSLVTMTQATYGATLSNHLTVQSIQSRDGQSIVQPLDAQIFQFTYAPGSSLSFGHRAAIEFTVLRDLPHLLGRTPRGFLSMGSWYCQLGPAAASDFGDTNYGPIHVFTPPPGQTPISATSGASITGANPTKPGPDGNTFDLAISFPVQRSTATGLVINPQAFRAFFGRILLF